MNVIFISSECSPFAKASSTADLVFKLSKEIERLGHNVKVFLPRYGSIDPSICHIERIPIDFKVRFNDSNILTLVYKGILQGSLVSLFFIESQNYFSNSKEIHLTNLQDEERFKFFSVATLEVISKLKFDADIIHLFNTDVAYTTKLLRSKNIEYVYLGKVGVVFTISEIKNNMLTAIKEAVNNSDCITTVSKSYAHELLANTHDTGLSELLLKKKDSFCGILSGIDDDIYNPESDSEIALNYSKNYFSPGKRKCKEDLLELTGLNKDLQTPIFGVIADLVSQNELEILTYSISYLLSLNIQLVILEKYNSREELIKLQDKYKNIKIIQSNEISLIKKFFAGTDFFINLNSSTPCGTDILTAMRYGSIPLTYETGAIRDILFDIENTEEGNGIIFKNYLKEDFLIAIEKAVKIYKNKEKWPRLVKQAMSFDSKSLDAGKQYIKCYEKIIKTSITIG